MKKNIIISTLTALSLLFTSTLIAYADTRTVSGIRANVTSVFVGDDETFGSQEKWADQNNPDYVEPVRPIDNRTAGKIKPPAGWKYIGGANSSCPIPLHYTYTDADGYTGILTKTDWDREVVMGYNGVGTNGEINEYTFYYDADHYTGTTDAKGNKIYYNGCTMKDIGIYSGTLTKDGEVTPTPTPVDDNHPPKAYISAPPEVPLGDEFYVSGNGTDPDSYDQGKLIYGWSSGGFDGFITGSGGLLTATTLGTYQVAITVIDTKGASDTAIATVKVVPPIPQINVTQTGLLKENRKIDIDAAVSSGGSTKATIDWTKTKWILTAVSGGTNSDIRVQTHVIGSNDGEILIDSSRGVNKPLDSLKSFDLTFKKTGTYKLHCEMTNNYGYSNTKDITLNVVVDQTPVASFSYPNKNYRDPADPAPNGYSQATYQLTDNSYSPDADTIAKRGYIVCFDSDNDGSFDDETAYVYDIDSSLTTQIPNNYSDNLHWRSVGLFKDLKNTLKFDTANFDNLTTIDFKTTHVGKYIFAEYVVEEFGQAYIPQFVTGSDRKTNLLIN